MNAWTGRRRRGLSLGVAIALFLIAITVIAIAVIWMGGATGQLTRVQKIEIQSTGCTRQEGGWTAKIKLKNVGTLETTLTRLFINDNEVDDYNQADTGYVYIDHWATNMTQQEAIPCGATISVLVYIDPDRAGSSLSSRTLIGLKLHTLNGADYLTTLELP